MTHRATRRNTRSRRAQQGFSLVEVLTALAVLVLLTGFVVAGVGTATKVYRQETFSSQADILSSTVESALSDPLRFMETKARNVDGETTVEHSIAYNGSTIVEPVLGSAVTTSGAKVLYLASATQPDAERVKLLNEGIYGDCVVTLQQPDGTPVDELSLVPSSATGAITLNCTIASTRDAKLSKSYTFTYVALGDRIAKKEVSDS